MLWLSTTTKSVLGSSCKGDAALQGGWSVGSAAGRQETLPPGRAPHVPW